MNPRHLILETSVLPTELRTLSKEYINNLLKLQDSTKINIVMTLHNQKFLPIYHHKYLPHNFLAEKMLLSCLLLNSKAIDITMKQLSIDSFYFKNHQEIFKAIIFMYQKNLLIDIITLTTFLQENGLLKKIGGIKILIELINEVPNIIYLEEYIKLIKDKFLRRMLIKIGYKVINAGYVTNVSLENILTEFEHQLFNLNTNLKSYKLLNTTELVYQIFL